MTQALTIGCACGKLGGVVRRRDDEPGCRVVCYCDDCQAFAHAQDRAGDVLDRHGGTDLLQISPVQLTIEQGGDQLACLRLTTKGLLRWYARCCGAPLGNTPPTRFVPFLGLLTTSIDRPSEGQPLDAVLGPVQFRVHARFAHGDRTRLAAHDRAPPRYLLGALWTIVRRLCRGEHRRNPLFDVESGQPLVTPRILDAAERRALAQRIAA